jgi:hypothetical protein
VLNDVRISSDDLKMMLTDKDFGIRYWGLVGVMMNKDSSQELKATLINMLKDDSHVNIGMAAWMLWEIGENKISEAAFTKLIQMNSYAILEVLNMIDHIDLKSSALLPLIENAQMENKYARAMQFNITSRYSH